MKSGNSIENGNQQLPEKNDDDLLWQSELKGSFIQFYRENGTRVQILICLLDLLWLELQAWISGRSPYEQDEYFFNHRQKIPAILQKIMEYRFQPNVLTELKETVLVKF